MSGEDKPVERPSGQEFWTGERCYILELLNDPERPDVSVARARVEPGVTTERHSLAVLEWYVIESGSGRMRLGDGPAFDVGPGDTVRIPPDCEQQVSNIGDEDLLFLCVCVPRFDPSCYKACE